MGTVISKDIRRISFDNTISVNPIIFQKSINDSDELVVNDFNEISHNELNIEKNTNNIIMHENEEDYWTQRLDNLKKEHKVINHIIEKEYEKSIEKSDKLFEKQNVTQERINKLKPCFDWRSKIVQCYEDNPHQSLVCSAVVQAFNDCIKSCQLEN